MTTSTLATIGLTCAIMQTCSPAGLEEKVADMADAKGIPFAGKTLRAWAQDHRAEKVPVGYTIRYHYYLNGQEFVDFHKIEKGGPYLVEIDKAPAIPFIPRPNDPEEAANTIAEILLDQTNAVKFMGIDLGVNPLGEAK